LIANFGSESLSHATEVLNFTKLINDQSSHLLRESTSCTRLPIIYVLKNDKKDFCSLMGE